MRGRKIGASLVAALAWAVMPLGADAGKEAAYVRLSEPAHDSPYADIAVWADEVADAAFAGEISDRNHRAIRRLELEAKRAPSSQAERWMLHYQLGRAYLARDCRVPEGCRTARAERQFHKVLATAMIRHGADPKHPDNALAVHAARANGYERLAANTRLAGESRISAR